jgi:hypothetical protein
MKSKKMGLEVTKKEILVLFMGCVLVTLKLSAQEKIMFYEYKIQYDMSTPNDSSVTLLGRQYFDSKMHHTKDIVFGPEKNDSCWTSWQYDKNGRLTKEIGKCSQTSVKVISIYKYRSDDNGLAQEEVLFQYKPFFQIVLTRKWKDSLIKEFYSSKKKMERGIYERKDKEVFNDLGKSILSFGINYNGDTSRYNVYLYFPITDTNEVRSKINQLGKVDEIIYLGSSNKEEVKDFYDSTGLRGRTIFAYDVKKNIILEEHRNMITNELIYKIGYKYDASGNLLQKRDENLRDNLTKTYTYYLGKIVREDYLFGNKLDHSIVYSNKQLY